MRLSRPLLIWALFCLLAGAIFLAYASASLAAGRGEFVLPLDDVYIHFQYARQMATGQPYVYNPGQPATSGATSFLYPFVLTAGYLLGFQGLNLGLWAMIVGALALLGSLWLVYRLMLAFDAPDWLAVLIALIFGLTGAVNWHFMSGMETGLMILFTLATLYTVVTPQFRGFILSASLLALTRPEGGILAVTAVITMFFLIGVYGDGPLRRRKYIWLLIPILALFVQPLVNLISTGSVVATGNAAKSLFGMVPFYWDVVLARIVENIERMWADFITGISPREGVYLPWLIGPLAFVGLLIALIRRDRWQVSLMVILWLLAGTAAIATLDTAFWHFKRYQMPLMALFFPLAGLALIQIFQRKNGATQRGKWALNHAGAMLILAGIALAAALPTSAAFLHHFALNVDYVYLQPLQMARWLRENTPADALIAVHDVGMMRYMGGRNTLDMVGLTTPGAAAYWRNGPGSIAEFLIQERPDYIAAYGEGHGLGLGMIAQTRIYGDPLAEFPVVLDDHFNVALAADYQGVYEPDWKGIVQLYGESFSQETVVLNVANLTSEEAYDYVWEDRERLPGFPTDVRELTIPGCSLDSCQLVDGARRINGEESFTLPTEPDKRVNLLSIVHAAQHGTLDVYVNDMFIDRNWIPEAPGQVVGIPTIIPADVVTDKMTKIRIEVDVPGGHYLPLAHIALQDELPIKDTPEEILASYQNGAIILPDFDLKLTENDLELDLHWYNTGGAEGDFRFFAHLYADQNQPPLAQTDKYPGLSMAPPGNWLPGDNRDRVVVDLSDVAPGTYQLAIGFYNPYTGERLMPESDVYEVSADGRLWLGNIEVPAEN